MAKTVKFRDMSPKDLRTLADSMGYMDQVDVSASERVAEKFRLKLAGFLPRNENERDGNG